MEPPVGFSRRKHAHQNRCEQKTEICRNGKQRISSDVGKHNAKRQINKGIDAKIANQKGKIKKGHHCKNDHSEILHGAPCSQIVVICAGYSKRNSCDRISSAEHTAAQCICFEILQKAIKDRCVAAALCFRDTAYCGTEGSKHSDHRKRKQQKHHGEPQAIPDKVHRPVQKRTDTLAPAFLGRSHEFTSLFSCLKQQAHRGIVPS